MTKRIIVGVLALLVTSLTPLGVSAQPGATGNRDWLRSSDTHRQSTGAAGPSRSGVGRALAALALVAVGAVVIWKKTRHARSSPLPTKTHIRVVGGTLVGPKARAVVADVGGRLILLGVTEQSVRKLAWLDAIDGIDASEDEDEDELPGHMTPESQPQRFSSQKRHDTRHNDSTKSSKFSAVLRDAVGLKAKPADSALVLAESTRDHVNLTMTKGQSRREAQLIDIEGQAAGLVSRLSKVKQ